MPYLLYDVEAARESGNNDHPVSALRKLGCNNAEVVAGHESIGVVRVFVDVINFTLPEYITLDNEPPRKEIKIVTDIRKSPTKKG